MLTENKYYIKIMADYSQKRSYAEKERDKRVEKAYEACPELEKLDKEITALGLENMGRILADRANSAKYNAEFEKKLAELKAKRSKILEANGIPANFDVPEYICPVCSDTGYVDGKKCACLKQQLIDLAYDISNMKNLIADQTFDKFDFTYYGDTKVPNLDMTERENIEDIVNISINFCKKPEESKNLLFYGNVGLGKTYLSSCIAKEMLDKGYTVIYSGASRLFAAYDDYRFGRMSDSEDFEDLLKLVYDADLLIIDDLGVEMHGPSSFQFFFDLMNERILKNKRMIISTNLSLEDISKVYTARITSRLFENFHCLRFAATDIRTQKLIREKKGH